jgi:hypothetical protein
MRSIVAAIVVLSTLPGCAHGQSATAQRSSTVLLKVISASDNATRIPAAEVFTVGDHGALVRVGVTDTYGEIKLDRAALPKSSNVVAILVCHPVFFCGALRADYVAARDEMTLAIAPAVSD